jgi:hypothetical protein
MADVKETSENQIGKGKAGPGRPKGLPNKTTALLKDAILQAAENAGNKVGDNGLVTYLEQQATENPGPFLSLLGKVLPMQVVGDLSVTVQTKEQRDAAVAAALQADD